MTCRKRGTHFVGLIVLLAASSLGAQTPSSAALWEIETLRRELNELRERVDARRAPGEEPRLPETSPLREARLHLGPGAAAIYDKSPGYHVGAAAEFTTYRARPTDTTAASHGVARFSPFLAYRLSSQLLFNSKVTFTDGGPQAHDGGSNQPGSAFVEFAYVDFTWRPTFNVRLGHMLVPVGLINPTQDPVLYPTVTRPEVETEILLSTWHENGLVLWGQSRHATVQLGVFNALDATTWTLPGRSTLKEGRQNGVSAKAEDVMGVARIDYARGGLLVGGSYVYGDATQDTALQRLTFHVWDAHLRFQNRWLEVQAVYAATRLDQARVLTRLVAEETAGYYVNAAVDLLAFADIRLVSETRAALPIFVQHSEYDLNTRMPVGQARDPELERTRTTVGFNLKPVPQLGLKANYEFRQNARRDEKDAFEFGAGIVF